MGLFGNSYNRPGPGVNKNEPKKKPFFLFFELFFRKFWKLIQLNLLFCIPVVVIGLLSYLLNQFTTNAFIVYFPIILLFPFIAGIAFVTRNYAREEHAFLLSDFKDAIAKNWVQFLINGVVSYAAYFILNIATSYYSAQVNANWIFFIPLALCIAISALLIFAQYYIPVMIITFDLKMKDVYKNAFIFAIVGLWRNILISVIFAVLIFGMYILLFLSPLTLIIAILLMIFILFSLFMFLTNFAVYPLIDRIMIQPYQNKLDTDNSDFND